jgi:type II secretory pathway component GspD/PulD (secretin)
MIGDDNSETNTQGDNGIPLLKNLSLVGTLFKHSSNSKEIKERVYLVSPSDGEIRSDDHKYGRFAQEGHLNIDAGLEPEEYPLTTKWPKEAKKGQRIQLRDYILKCVSVLVN